MKNRLMAAASPFAHLMGLGAKAARAEDTEDEKDKDATAKAEGDESETDDEEEKKAANAKADTEDGDPDDDEDEKEVESEDGDADMKSGKSAKAAAAARKAERARCRAIFASHHAEGRVALAAQLAFDTDLTAKQAIGVLAAAPAESTTAGGPKSARQRLDDRMANAKTPVLGPDAPAPAPGSPQGRAAAIVGIYEKLTGGAAK